jgi:hypothetical protein
MDTLDGMKQSDASTGNTSGQAQGDGSQSTSKGVQPVNKTKN